MSTSPITQNIQNFSHAVLDCVVGGSSALDLPRLDIHHIADAEKFIHAYGYDLSREEDTQNIWDIHRKSIELIQDHLLEPGEVIPQRVADPQQLKDIGQLLILASSKEFHERELQRWACAILRVMHVYVHLRYDLFSAFRDEIQSQILKPLESVIFRDLELDRTVMRAKSDEIELASFELKPFKTTASSVIKLLAKSDRVALTLLDKVGVRFVTKNIFDSFRVIRLLLDEHLMNFSHIIPDQSGNTLYPLNLFKQVIDEVSAGGQPIDYAKIEALLKSRLDATWKPEFKERDNSFTDKDYRFIKFINRKLVSIRFNNEGGEQSHIRFFYPYEVQILDQATYQNTMTGPMAHDEYKQRQKRKRESG